jgi:hypothetical protein
MTLRLNHAFITCDVGAPEANALLARGFIEGSRNMHPGQGTANRRFFFTNFMLELVWVSDPVEAMGVSVRPTELWERWSRRGEGVSRFGVILSGELPLGSSLPFTTQRYFPPYLPAGTSIEIAQGMSLYEPALFWMPWLGRDRSRSNEPINHAAAVQAVSGIAVGLPNINGLSSAAGRVRDAGLMRFIEASLPVLEVHFRGPSGMVIDFRPDLPLVFRGGSGGPSDAH